MKAARLHSYDDDRLQIDDVPEPTIQSPHDVIVRIGGAGLCRTDLHIIEGILAETFPDLELPYTLGHENAGWVEEVGSSVTAASVGDAVIVHPLVSCGVCHGCRRGEDMYCDAGAFPGLSQNGGFAEYLAGRSILFVGSHPDDEWGVAPMFAEACLHNGARCHFIVAADARSLGCKLSIGMDDRDRCTRLRREEMRASAAHFRAEVTFFGWEDLFYAFDRGGVERTLAEWSRAAGGQASLVEQLRAEILRVGPDVIFSLDPRHGTTCHPNHRALSLLLIDVL